MSSLRTKFANQLTPLSRVFRGGDRSSSLQFCMGRQSLIKKNKQKKNKQKKDDKYDDGWTFVGRRFRPWDDPRPWEDLPGLALVNIFSRTYFYDRLVKIPLVCRSWRSALDHPHCWSSMLPSSVSPEDVFIRKRYQGLYPRDVSFHPNRFETLIERAGGGSAITCLYLEPFFRNSFVSDFDIVCQLFHLIANRCPNLKHISFSGFYSSCLKGKQEAIVEIFRRCKRLELVDFSDSRELDSPVVIQEMGNHLPLLRGIRIKGRRDYDVADCIAKHLPWLKLLNLYQTCFDDDTYSLRTLSLSAILSNCVNLQYLNISLGRDVYFDQELMDLASARIGEFHWRGYLQYEDDAHYEDDDGGRSFCPCCFPFGRQEFYESDDYEWYDEQYYLFKNETDDYEWYDEQYCLLKNGRSDAFIRKRAKDRRRRELKFLKGYRKEYDLRRRSKCKPLIEYKLPYANNLFVVPV